MYKQVDEFTNTIYYYSSVSIAYLCSYVCQNEPNAFNNLYFAKCIIQLESNLPIIHTRMCSEKNL